MSFRSNAHTHTTYCDGKSTVSQVLAQARSLGFVSLGFSGHAAQGFDWRYCMDETAQAAYFAQLRALQRQPDAPRLWVGLEQDLLAADELRAGNRAQADYIIGSTHYLRETLDGQTVAVDGDPELLKRCVALRFGGDPMKMAEEYYELHACGVERDRPEIIGHFDLVRIYEAQTGLDTGCDRYRRMALDALRRMARRGGVMEVNTGAMARRGAPAPYPAAFLLEAWRAQGGRITLTSDCHLASQLNYAFPETLRLLHELGYRTALRLGTHDALWEEEAI